jgi:TolC family type I secretion outer membrane protein
MKKRYMPARPQLWLLIAGWLLSAPAVAVDWQDPFATGSLASQQTTGSAHTSRVDACLETAVDATLGLADVIDRVLCHNPQSNQAWANARYQAAQVGVARSAFLPNVTATGGAGRTWESGSGRPAYNALSGDVTLSYLLYDFGGRDASLETARQLFSAASATQDSVVQGLFLSAIQGYYQANAADAALASAQEAERSAQASLDAAIARYKAGVATPADKLQAQTAYSQAVLNRITSEGNLRNARGTLANLMGLDANRTVTLKATPAAPAQSQFDTGVDELIAQARRARPDLAAAEAQFKAAQASIGVAEAAGKPSISVSTGLGYSDVQYAGSVRSESIGLNVTIPLFTGFSNTYRIRSAKELAETRKAAVDQINLQIALDVWKAYQNLQTASQSIATSTDLVASATQNADVALGRYKAGVGNIIDTITAQAALASARNQQIQSRLNWDIARASLAYAIGRLDDVQTYSLENPK